MSKIAIEKGDFNWNVGRGYEAPADGPNMVGVPPEWNVEMPDYHEPASSTVRARQRETAPSQHLEQRVEGNIIERAIEDVKITLPDNRVNLDAATAVYMGYSIPLSDVALATIKSLLAKEVCRTLEQEKTRVISALAGLGEPEDGDELGDMRPVPKKTRRPRHNDMRPLQGKNKSIKASRTKARSAVSGSDDSGVS